MAALIEASNLALALWQSGFPLRPDAASTSAGQVVWLYFVLTGITLFFTVGIFLTIFYFMLKYRRHAEDYIPPPTRQSNVIEVTWIVIPALICIFLFVWATRLYFRNAEP